VQLQLRALGSGFLINRALQKGMLVGKDGSMEDWWKQRIEVWKYGGREGWKYEGMMEGLD